jgi:hypothetical protein
VQLQERALAEAENRPPPPQCSSSDVRPLKFNDFKQAHEQVNIIATHVLYYLSHRKTDEQEYRK